MTTKFLIWWFRYLLIFLLFWYLWKPFMKPSMWWNLVKNVQWILPHTWIILKRPTVPQNPPWVYHSFSITSFSLFSSLHHTSTIYWHSQKACYTPNKSAKSLNMQREFLYWISASEHCSSILNKVNLSEGGHREYLRFLIAPQDSNGARFPRTESFRKHKTYIKQTLLTLPLLPDSAKSDSHPVFVHRVCVCVFDYLEGSMHVQGESVWVNSGRRPLHVHTSDQSLQHNHQPCRQSLATQQAVPHGRPITRMSHCLPPAVCPLYGLVEVTRDTDLIIPVNCISSRGVGFYLQTFLVSYLTRIIFIFSRYHPGPTK